MPKVPKLSVQLRAALKSCGLSGYRIGKELGIDEATLSRFMSGKRGLRMSVLDRLSVFLGVRIVIDRKRKRSKQ
jgi:transcriptional regulator with XRE-family HTH domain